MTFRTRTIKATQGNPVTGIDNSLYNGWVQFRSITQYRKTVDGATGALGPIVQQFKGGQGKRVGIANGQFSIPLEVSADSDTDTFGYEWTMDDGQTGKFNISWSAPNGESGEGSDIIFGTLWPPSTTVPTDPAPVITDNDLSNNTLVVGAGSNKIKTTVGTAGQVWQQIDGSSQGWQNLPAEDPNTLKAPAGNVGANIIITSSDGDPANMGAVIGTQGQVWTQIDGDVPFSQGFADVPVQPDYDGVITVGTNGDYASLTEAIENRGTYNTFRILSGVVAWNASAQPLPNGSRLIGGNLNSIIQISGVTGLTLTEVTLDGNLLLQNANIASDLTFNLVRCNQSGGLLDLFTRTTNGTHVTFNNVTTQRVKIQALPETIGTGPIAIVSRSNIGDLEVVLNNVTSVGNSQLVEFDTSDEASSIARLTVNQGGTPAPTPTPYTVLGLTNDTDRNAVHVGSIGYGAGVDPSAATITLKTTAANILFPNPTITIGKGGAFSTFKDYLRQADAAAKETVLILDQGDVGTGAAGGVATLTNKVIKGIGYQVPLSLSYSDFNGFSSTLLENLNITLGFSASGSIGGSTLFRYCGIVGGGESCLLSTSVRFEFCDIATLGASSNPMFTVFNSPVARLPVTFVDCNITNQNSNSKPLVEIGLNEGEFVIDGGALLTSAPLLTATGNVGQVITLKNLNALPIPTQPLLEILSTQVAGTITVLLANNNFKRLPSGTLLVNNGTGSTVAEVLSTGNILGGATLTSGTWTTL